MLAENSADGIDRLDRHYRHTYVNAVFAQMLALPAEAIIGRTTQELGVSDPMARLWEEHARSVFESGETLEVENSLPQASGHRFFNTRYMAERGPDGTVCAVVAIYRDITGRTRSEAALRESEERLRFAHRVGGIGAFDCDLATGVITRTPELAAMHGLPVGGFAGTQSAWEDLIHPDDRASVLRLVENAAENGSLGEGEWRVVWPDGTVHWLTGRWQDITDEAGVPVRRMGVNIDITERKRMNEALRQSEERFRLAVQATGDAIWDVDMVTGLVSWNEQYTALFGSPPERSDFWRWWSDRIHPEDRARAEDGLRSAIGGNAESWTCEYRFRRMDDTWAHIYDRAYIARDPYGNAMRMVGAVQDLTDRKQAEATRLETDLQYKELFDNISVCLFVIDVTPDGRFKYVGFNPAEEEAVGLSTADVSGKFVEEVFGDELAEKLTADYRRCVESGRTIQFDSELNFPGGRRYFHSNLIPWRSAAGVITRITGACIDTTDFRRTQEEALAKQNLESLGVLAGGIAHDFNNVLGCILARAELVEMELTEGSAASEDIEKLKASAIRGSEIVRELMIYAGQDQPRVLEPVGVSHLVEEMLELLKVSISKHAALRTDLAKDLPAVSGSEPQIRQVVMNLVINASEAIGEKDGLITLKTAYVRNAGDQDLDDAPNFPHGKYVRLEISDTGGGITEETKCKIFDPFFSTKFAGRGMGLAVVQEIVREHGGLIRVSSLPGQGTTFQVYLPCAEEQSADIRSAAPVAGRHPADARTGTILVVEDEDLLREAVSKALQKTGTGVLEASNGSDAMDLLRAHIDDLDAVLLDVTLPGISSRDIFSEARKMRPDLRVVVTSAYSKETVDASFAGLRVQHFIRKPFHLSDVVHMLKNPVPV